MVCWEEGLTSACLWQNRHSLEGNSRLLSKLSGATTCSVTLVQCSAEW